MATGSCCALGRVAVRLGMFHFLSVSLCLWLSRGPTPGSLQVAGSGLQQMVFSPNHSQKVTNSDIAYEFHSYPPRPRSPPVPSCRHPALEGETTTSRFSPHGL